MLALLTVIASPDALAQISLYVQSIDIEPGTGATLRLNLDNKESFYGFQAEITLPQGMTVVKTDGRLDISLCDRTDATYQLVTNFTNGKYYIGAFSSVPGKQTPISGNSGAVLEMKVMTSKSLFNGGNVTLDNIKLTNADDEDVALRKKETQIGVLPVSIAFNYSEIGVLQNYTAERPLEVIFSPASVTNTTIKEWSSDDESIATIDDKGFVTGTHSDDKQIRTTKVRAVSINGKVATATVKVYPSTEDLFVTPTEIVIERNKEAVIAAIIGPDNSIQPVTWVSSNPNVVTVSEESADVVLGQGRTLKAIEKGEADITVSSGRFSAQCHVEVIVVPEYIEVNPWKASIQGEGSTLQLEATIEPADCDEEYKTLTWESSDETVATVDANGMVTSVGFGEATITVTTVNGLQDRCEVTVEPVQVGGVYILEDAVRMHVNHLDDVDDTQQLTVVVLPENATYKGVIWSSDNEEVATVDQNGLVTALDYGVANIYAASEYDPSLSDVCVVTVGPVEVESITLTNTELLMRVGYTSELMAIVHPDNACDKSVVWSSDNEAIATVDQDGIVTAHAVGQVNIIATSVAYPDVKGVCAVTVVPEETITAVTDLTISDSELELFVGDTYTILATVLPEDATDKTVTWRSSDWSVVTVTQEGYVTAVGIGTAIIYASSSNGLTVECAVTVKPVPVASISLTNTELLMRVGYTSELLAIVRPDNAYEKRVYWSSDNEEIATVDQDGIVTAHAVGTANIYATSIVDPSIQGVCVVTVVEEHTVTAVTDIILSDSKITIIIPDTYQLTATILPEDATDKTVTWKSSDRSVVTVDQDGLVTSVGLGTAIVYASSSNGLTVECEVTVIASAHSEDPERLVTPRQMLRKGDGTTSTFIVLIDIPEEVLKERNYQFAYGYTAPSGQSTLIAETPLRYCHTTPEIFNDPTYDFWVFAFIELGDGKIINSNLRHLDGREENCPDASIYRTNISRAVDDSDWFRLTPSTLYVTPDVAGELRVAIYGITGIPVYSATRHGDASEALEVGLDQFADGIYVVTANCGGKTRSKRIMIRK